MSKKYKIKEGIASWQKLRIFGKKGYMIIGLQYDIIVANKTGLKYFDSLIDLKKALEMI